MLPPEHVQHVDVRTWERHVDHDEIVATMRRLSGRAAAGPGSAPAREPLLEQPVERAIGVGDQYAYRTNPALPLSVGRVRRLAHRLLPSARRRARPPRALPASTPPGTRRPRRRRVWHRARCRARFSLSSSSPEYQSPALKLSAASVQASTFSSVIHTRPWWADTVVPAASRMRTI